MDFHSLPRRQLQTLCKQYKIPANTTNVAMATALHNLLNNGGISQASVSELLTPNKAEAPPALATPGRMTRSQLKKQLQEVPKLDIEATEHTVLESSKKPPASRKSTLCSSSTTEPKHREQKHLFDTSEDGELNSGISYQESDKSLSARKPRSSKVSSDSRVPKSAVVSASGRHATSEGQSEEVSSAPASVATQESFKVSVEEHPEDVEDAAAGLSSGVAKSEQVEEVVPAKDTEADVDSAMAIDENLMEDINADIAESFENQRWKYTCCKAVDTAAGKEKLDRSGGAEKSDLEHASEETSLNSGAAKGQDASEAEQVVFELDQVVAEENIGASVTEDAEGNQDEEQHVGDSEPDQVVAEENFGASVTEDAEGNQDEEQHVGDSVADTHYPEVDQVVTEENLGASETEDVERIQDEEQHNGDSAADTEAYMMTEAEEEEEVKMMVVTVIEEPDTKSKEDSYSVEEQASRMDDDQSEVKIGGAPECAQEDEVEQLLVALSEVKLSGKAEKQKKLEQSAIGKENIPFGFEKLSLRQLRKVYKTRVEKKVKRVNPKSGVTPLSPNVKKNNSAH